MSFVGPSYHLNTRKADVQRVVNLMPVVNEVQGTKSVAYLDSIPGLREFSTTTTGLPSILLESGDYLLLEGGGHILLES